MPAELVYNPLTHDHHMHTDTYSDGTSPLEVLVRYAGEIGLEEIAITDHSDAALQLFGPTYQFGDFKFELFGRKFTFDGFNIKLPYRPTASRDTLARWNNIHDSNLKVIFGVEGDILNERGDICSTVNKIEGDYLVLSLHPNVYARNGGNRELVTNAYTNAMERHHEKIKVIGHPTARIKYGAPPILDKLDLGFVIDVANHFEIPLELNGSYVEKGLMDDNKTRQMLEGARYVMINSDAHTLNALRDYRQVASEYAQSLGFFTSVTSTGK